MSRQTWPVILVAAIAAVGLSKDSDCDRKFGEAVQAALHGPSLAGVEVFYSWTGGYGPGEVEAVIRADQESVLTLRRWKEQPEVHRSQVPVARVRSILQSVVDSQVECMVVRERDRCAEDLGKYIVRIRVPGAEREIYYDGDHALTRPGKRGIGDVLDSVYSLSEEFGAQFDWGPYGLYWGKCPAK